MPAIGIEPIREYKSRRILSPVRLPVPPRRQRKNRTIRYFLCLILLRRMGGGGFEPPKQFAADLQSVPFGHSGNHPYYILFSFYCFMQADDRTRTDNLLITNQLLCQLSHIGELLIRTLHTEWDLQGSNL